MKAKAHIFVWNVVAGTAIILNYNNIIDIFKVSFELSSFYHKIWISPVLSALFQTNPHQNISLILSNIESFLWVNITYSAELAFVLLLSFLFGNIVNDLDNPKSLIGRIFFFISYPAWIISIITYKMLYPNSWRGIWNTVGGWLSGLAKQFAVTHRVLFHTEIWLILLVITQTYLLSALSINNDFIAIANVGLTFWYITHILCDALSGKVPLPITIRLLFIVIWYRKETFWLSLG
jgi:hypothetical protein